MCELLCVWQIDKQRQEANRELDELAERLDEAGGATAAQVNITTLPHLYTYDYNTKTYIT